MTCQEAIDVMGEAVEGRLATGLRPGFDEHMAVCAPCATYYQQLRLTRGTLRSLPPERRGSPRRSELIEAFRREFGRGGDVK
jgi:hypothetical protein